MKIKRVLTAFLAVLLMASLCGCQLAREDAGGTEEKDKLIGVFVTREYLDLFDMDGYLSDNLQNLSGGEFHVDGNNEKYQGRLYAVLQDITLTSDTGEQSTMQEYVFPDVDGVSYFAARVPAAEGRESYISSGSDEAISDGQLGLNYGDTEDKITLDGTIYLADLSGNYSCYINPVYQSEDGSVYAVSGGGMEMCSGAGMSQTLEEKSTVTENGVSKTVISSIKISIETLPPPEKIVLLQMDKDSTILSKAEYNPGELPGTLKPEPATAYILEETYAHDVSGEEVVTRKLFGAEDAVLSAFYARADGICVRQWTTLAWETSLR
ncbi:MAG: hypothetical protein ABFC73_06105 [Clostridiaceae bacterium]